MNKTAQFSEFRKKAILQEDTVFDTQEAANYLDIPKSKIYTLMRGKKIPLYKRGRKIYFFKSQLTNWVNEGGLN